MNLTRIFAFLGASLFLISCGSQKKLAKPSPDSIQNPVYEKVTFASEDSISPEFSSETEISEESFVSKITRYARDFLGTSYKYGGTGPDGMDCSGLVYTAFSYEDIYLPRSSRDMATLGEELNLKQVINGDLLFFRTNPGKKAINHVGLVVDVGEGIFFIHSTTSRGVIISSLSEKYWQDHFVMARRIQ